MVDKGIQCDLIKPTFTTSTPVNSDSDEGPGELEELSYRPGDSTIHDASENQSFNE